MVNVRADRPTVPWQPAKLSVYPVRSTMTKGATPRKVWRVRWRVDGVEFVLQFPRAADAHAWSADLLAGKALDLWFDPTAKRYRETAPGPPPPPVAPVAPPAPPAREVGEAVTVFEVTGRYWEWKWPALQPKAREELARYLNRLRRHLVTRQPTSSHEPAVASFLRRHSLTVRGHGAVGDADRVGLDWLRTHSLRLDQVGPKEIEAFLGRFATDQRDPTRVVAPATQRRMIADLRPMWAWATNTGLITDDPWARVEPPTLHTGGRPAARNQARPAPAAADLVLSPAEIRALACLCSVVGPWDGRVVCYVLVMGFCGLRPGEALGLVVGDLELPPTGTGWLTVRRNRRRAGHRFIEHDEDADWGPLKARTVTHVRRVPIPSELVALLGTHLALFCPDARPTDLVFHRHGKPFNLEVFSRDAWAPARAAMFPPDPDLPPHSPLQPKRSRLRRHDLRHAACSMWLRAGVDVAICQRWSGHAQLDVFLDVYQGVIPGQLAAGAARLDAHLLDAHLLDATSVRDALLGAHRSGRALDDLAEATGIPVATLDDLATGAAPTVAPPTVELLAVAAAHTLDDIYGSADTTSDPPAGADLLLTRCFVRARLPADTTSHDLEHAIGTAIRNALGDAGVALDIVRIAHILSPIWSHTTQRHRSERPDADDEEP